MKRIFAVLGVCALLLAPVSAHAAAHTWSGANNSDWRFIDGEFGSNWVTPPSGYPGQSGGAGDTATIASATNANPFYLDGSLTDSLAWVKLDAETATGSLELELRTGSSMTITDYLHIEGDVGSDQSATVQFIAGTLSFDSAPLYLYGGDASARKALFDYDGGTISDNIDGVVMQDYSAIDAEDSMTIDGAVTVNADGAATVATIDMLTGETFAASSMAIGHTGYSCQLTLQDQGTFDVNGTVSMVAPTTDNVHPKLVVASTVASPFTPDAFDINGGASAIRSAQLDFDQNVTATVANSYLDGYVDADVASGKTTTLLELRLNDAADTVVSMTKAGAGAVSATKVVIKGGDAGGEIATCAVSAGSIVTR